MKNQTVRANMRWGLAWGGFFALAYIAYATIVYLIEGKEAFARHSVTYVQAVVGYALAGVSAGLLLAVLRPLLDSKACTVAAGPLIAGAVLIPMAVIIRGPIWAWTRVEWLPIAFLSLAFGLFVALVFGRIFRSDGD